MRSKIPTAILLAEFYSTQQYPVPVYQAMNAIKRRGGYIYDVVHRSGRAGDSLWGRMQELTYPTIKQLESMRSLKALPAAYYKDGKESKHPDARVDLEAKPYALAARLAAIQNEFNVIDAAVAWGLETPKAAHNPINTLKAEGLVEKTNIKIDNYAIYRKTQLAHTFEQQFRSDDE